MTGFFGFMFFIVGLVMAFWPYSAWYLSVGWQLKDAQPSNLALSIGRINGSIFVIVGFVMMVSSCSLGGSADRNWSEQFKEKLAAGEVQEITIGMITPVTLTLEETIVVTNMIQEAELRAFDPGDSYAANDTGRILFKDKTSIELVIFGPSGGIELHPDNTEEKYIIMSEDLKKWFQKNHRNQ